MLASTRKEAADLRADASIRPYNPFKKGFVGAGHARPLPRYDIYYNYKGATLCL